MIRNDEYLNCIEKCSDEVHHSLHICDGTVLISGASGMIGSVIIDCLMLLNAKYGARIKIVALGRTRLCTDSPLNMYMGSNMFTYFQCDVNEPLPEVGNVDYVIHAASNTHPLAYSNDPIGTIKTNIIGTEHLLEYARTHAGQRFIFLSSVEIYGENTGDREAYRETDCGYIDCNTVRASYPESKRVGESLCCAYGSKYGMDIVIPRLCRIYGPTMKREDSKALSQFIWKAVKKEDIVLKSQGNQYFSYLYVMDAVKAIFYIWDRGKSGEAYNVSSKLSDFRLVQLAKKLADIAGTQVVFELPNETEQRGYSKATTAILDNSKLRQLGWKEDYDMEQGLWMTVEILREVEKKADRRNSFDTVGQRYFAETSDG